jgi:hypothetical protein
MICPVQYFTLSLILLTFCSSSLLCSCAAPPDVHSSLLPLRTSPKIVLLVCSVARTRLRLEVSLVELAVQVPVLARQEDPVRLEPSTSSSRVESTTSQHRRTAGSGATHWPVAGCQVEKSSQRKCLTEKMITSKNRPKESI